MDPTETDQSELIIDPENITQWVDNALPTPHKISIELLAKKFPSLNEYDADVKEIRSLIKDACPPRIVAPANTICRVLQSIQEEESGIPVTPVPCFDNDFVAKGTSTVSISIPANKDHPTVEGHHLSQPFKIEFPQKSKKGSRYFFPIAALLLLTALVASIMIIENNSEHHVAHKEDTQPSVPTHQRDRKAEIMSSPAPTPHVKKGLPNVQLANDNHQASPHSDEEKDVEAKNKEKQKNNKESAEAQPSVQEKSAP